MVFDVDGGVNGTMVGDGNDISGNVNGTIRGHIRDNET